MPLSDVLAHYSLSLDDAAQNVDRLVGLDDAQVEQLHGELAAAFNECRNDPDGADVGEMRNIGRVLGDLAAARGAAVGSALTASAQPGKWTPLPPLNSINAPRSHQPTVTRAVPRFMQLSERGAVVGDDASFRDLAEAVIEAHNHFQGQSIPQGWNERIPLGRMKLSYPEDRVVEPGNDADANRKLDSLTKDAFMPERWERDALVASGVDPDAITASGGYCSPPSPSFAIPQVSGAHRPVSDYLPTINARGQLVVVQPSRLADIGSSASQAAGSAVSVWPLSVDQAPGGTVKPRQTMSCPSPRTISPQAIVERVKVGNFASMAFPEQVAQFLANVASAWARRAESELLREIDTDAAVTAVTSTSVLGAAADYFGYLSRAAAAIRNHQRIPRTAMLRAIVPGWLVDLVRSDLAHSHAGDGTNRFTDDPETFVRAAARASYVNLTFTEDSAVMTPGSVANQLFPPQGPSDLENYPPTPGTTNARVLTYLFPEGNWARADAGTLDLGVVRDSSLNDTNDFEVFSESVEAAVPRIIECYKWTATLCESGAGGTDTAASGYCTAS